MRPAVIAFVAVAVVVTGIASYFAFLPHSSDPIALWALAIGPALVLGALAAAWGAHEGLLREWLSPRWGDFTRGVVGAALIFCITWVFVRLVAPVGSPREIWLVALYGKIGDPRVLQAHAPFVAAAIGVAAMAEEVLWRGAVTQLLAERVGSRTAWIWSAGLYAAAYVPSMWSLRTTTELGSGLNPILLVGALGAGLIWGGMARGFGRLAPGVLSHALFVWAAVMMFPLWGTRQVQAIVAVALPSFR